MRLLLLTDLHMTGFERRADGIYPRIPAHAWQAQERRYDLMSTLVPMALRQAQEEFAPDFILLGGDTVDDGFAPGGRAELAQIRDLVTGLAGVPVAWLYGNHDGPQEQFAQVCGPLNWTRDVAGVRLVGLNSGTMETNEEMESARVAVAELRQALATNEGLPVVVALHQWIVPTDVYGYSLARAEEARALIEDDPNVLAVINGHFHDGKYDVQHGVHYCTARSMAEPPFVYSTFDVSDSQIVWTEYSLSRGEGRFVPGEPRVLSGWR
jgi:3',5'-cyclic AMP phosphodiesterase CpdA